MRQTASPHYRGGEGLPIFRALKDGPAGRTGGKHWREGTLARFAR
jgi:hypothetical protein